MKAIISRTIVPTNEDNAYQESPDYIIMPYSWEDYDSKAPEEALLCYMSVLSDSGRPECSPASECKYSIQWYGYTGMENKFIKYDNAGTPIETYEWAEVDSNEAYMGV